MVNRKWSDGPALVLLTVVSPFVRVAPRAEGQEQDIPAVSEWGLIVMALVLLTVGKVVFVQRRVPGEQR